MSIVPGLHGKYTPFFTLFLAILSAIVATMGLFAFFAALLLHFSPDGKTAPVALNTGIEFFLSMPIQGTLAVFWVLLFLLLIFLRKNRRFQILINKPHFWYFLTCVYFTRAMHLSLLAYATPVLSDMANMVTNFSSLSYLPDGTFDPSVLTGLLALFFLIIFPFLSVWYIWHQLAHALNLEIAKAYDAVAIYNDDYRKSYLANNHLAILARENQIRHTAQKQISWLRLKTIEKLWWGNDDLDMDVIRAYYQEPLLLLQLAKVHYGATSPLGGYPIMSDSQNTGRLIVPETFDLLRIKHDLLTYRFDSSVLSTYVIDLLTRFRAKSYRTKIKELIQLYDIAVQFQGKLYAYKKETGKVQSIAELETLLEEEKLKTQIYEERKKRQEPLQPEVVPPDELREQEYAEAEKKIAHEYRIQAVRERFKGDYEEEKRARKSKQFEEMIASYTKRKQDICNDSYLTQTAREEALRLLETTFINQLDAFEQTL